METQEEKDARLDRIFERRRQAGAHLKGLTLSNPADDVLRVCCECGAEIPDPYDLKGQQLMTCSTCALAPRPKREEPDPKDDQIESDRKCTCGYVLSECSKRDCLPGGFGSPGKPLKPKPGGKQGSLF